MFLKILLSGDKIFFELSVGVFGVYINGIYVLFKRVENGFCFEVDVNFKGF